MVYLGTGLDLLLRPVGRVTIRSPWPSLWNRRNAPTWRPTSKRPNLFFALLLHHVWSRMERRCIELRVVFYNNLGRLPDAIGVGLEGLALFDVSLPLEPATLEAAIQTELGKIGAYLESHSPDDILHAPQTQDSEVMKIMKFLINLAPPTCRNQPVPLHAPGAEAGHIVP